MNTRWMMGGSRARICLSATSLVTIRSVLYPLLPFFHSFLDVLFLSPSPWQDLSLPHAVGSDLNLFCVFGLVCVFFSFDCFLFSPQASRLYQENRREYNRRVREVVEQSWVDE